MADIAQNGLEIRVINQGIVAQPTQVNNSIESPTEFPSDTTQTGKESGLVGAFVLQLGKQTITDEIRRIGSFTGRQAKQLQIENVNKVVGFTGNVAMGYLVFGGSGFVIGLAKSAYDIVISQADISNTYNLEQIRRDDLNRYALAINSNNRSRGNL